MLENGKKARKKIARSTGLHGENDQEHGGGRAEYFALKLSSLLSTEMGIRAPYQTSGRECFSVKPVSLPSSGAVVRAPGQKCFSCREMRTTTPIGGFLFAGVKWLRHESIPFSLLSTVGVKPCLTAELAALQHGKLQQMDWPREKVEQTLNNTSGSIPMDYLGCVKLLLSES